MDYRELAVYFLEAAHPPGKRPPISRINELERVKDMTLAYLQRHDGRATPKELAGEFDVSSARVTRILGDLESEGLIVRSCDAGDRRRVIVEITPAGQQLVTEHFEGLVEKLSAVLQAMGPEDAPELVRLLIRMSDVMNELQDGCCGL